MAKIEDFYPLINKLVTKDFEKRLHVTQGFGKRIDFEEGGKLIKMVSVDLYNGVEKEYGRSAFGFIVKEDDTVKSIHGAFFKAGDILKAASWKAPAKNFARGNIFELTDKSPIRWTGI